MVPDDGFTSLFPSNDALSSLMDQVMSCRLCLLLTICLCFHDLFVVEPTCFTDVSQKYLGLETRLEHVSRYV